MEPKRVLVVDDELGVRMTLSGNLELEGYEVLEADSAEEALAVLARESVDLVLSDIRMPGMGGVALLRQVKAVHPQLPVVLMTAFTAEANIEEAIGCGVYTVLAKPFNLERAAELIARAMARPAVLIVDPAGGDTALLERELSRAGLRLERTSSPAEALALVRNGQSDLCVAQLGGDSREVLSLIETLRAERPDVAILAIAGAGSPALLSRLAVLGARCVAQPRPGKVLRAVSELRAAGAHA
jgi:DNA-binding NtrC family response regulator